MYLWPQAYPAMASRSERQLHESVQKALIKQFSHLIEMTVFLGVGNPLHDESKNDKQLMEGKYIIVHETRKVT